MFSLKKGLLSLNWRIIGNIVGYIAIASGCLMVLPLIVCFIYGEHVAMPFIISIVISLVVGLPLSQLKVKHTSYYAKEGMIAVGLAWIVVSFLGGLPFYFTNEIPSLVDCFFETVSGFTTTGSTILTDVEALSKASLFWRSLTHWVGGMGVLVFVLAFLPRTNARTMFLARAEMPGPTIGKLVPRMRQTAVILYELYMGLTVLEIIFLLVGGMPLYDTLIHTFGTAGTGGFSCWGASVGYYNNPYFDYVIGIFMVLFGVNFNLYYFLMIKDFKSVYKNQELHAYLAIVLGASVLIAWNTLTVYHSFTDSFRYAFFQVASIITTTGYATYDYNSWPMFSKTLLVLLTLLGACAGSTGGGIKVSRMLVLLKKMKLDVQRLIHPQKVDAITMDGKVVDDKTVNSILIYFAILMILIAGAFLVVSLDNFDFESTLTAVFTCISNVGPGLGLVGPAGNFAAFSDLSKIVLSFCMLIGRLEIYPILVFLFPVFQATEIHKKKFRR